MVEGPDLVEEVVRPDVVQVAMGEEDRLDVVGALADPPPVGQDEVDTEVLCVGEQHPDVHDGQPAR